MNINPYRAKHKIFDEPYYRSNPSVCMTEDRVRITIDLPLEQYRPNKEGLINWRKETIMDRKLSAAEKKYGENEHTELMLCPRCVCANPLKIAFNHAYAPERGIDICWKEYLCKKCLYYGHKEGALIKREKHIGNGELIGKPSFKRSLDETESLIDLNI